MNSDNITKYVLDWLIRFLLVIIVIVTIVGVLFHKKYISKPSSPVKKECTIDSLTKDNKTIIIEINKLDSIKNEQVVKIKAYNNDSTLMLFYQLLGK